MKIAVIGGGGREHAIIKKLKENKSIEKIYAIPGNGGMVNDAECVDISATDIKKIVDFSVSEKLDFVVVAPDDPLVLGAVDALNEVSIPCFGPKRDAAIIEGSKVFAKELMKKYNIPTAKYEVFSNMDEAIKYIDSAPVPTVVKADGLALGKGVFVCMTREEAKNAVLSLMNDKIFGNSGNNIVIEEYLEGPEISVLSFTDGNIVVPMVSSMDHKRAFDSDKGPNTGGMGTIAPNPFFTDKISEECMEEIFLPTVKAMKNEGREFRGCLYFGLMLTESGPKVIEYNCRFGDPETQVVLPLLQTDLFNIMLATSQGKLTKDMVKFSNKKSCCVIMASKGYPKKYDKGFEISVSDKFDAELFIAGAKIDNNKLLTNGGRVLGVTSVADTLEEAISKSYQNVKEVSFENAFYRMDIGKKALSIL